MQKIGYLNYLNPGYGHSQSDDLFWRSVFNHSNLNANYFVNRKTSLTQQFEESVKVLKYNTFNHKKIIFRFLSILKIFRIKISNYDRFVIQGFEEISLIFLLLINQSKKTEIIIICTNNLSLQRLKNNYLIRVLLKRIFKKVNKIIVHSKYEARLATVLSRDKSKVFIKKYHTISSTSQSRTPSNSNVKLNKSKTIITCFGPLKNDKSLQSLLTLINHPKSAEFEFLIVNIQKDNFNELQRRKIKFINTYLNESEYAKIFINSDFIFLINNNLFEPKLSGTLCDCMRYGVPFISMKIYPVIEYLRVFKDIGIVYELNLDIKTLFHDIANFDSTKASRAFKQLQIEYSSSIIVEETSRIILS